MAPPKCRCGFASWAFANNNASNCSAAIQISSAWFATPVSGSAPNWPTTSWSNLSTLESRHSVMPEESQPLTSLEVGSAGTVSEINVSAESRGRLLEMGLLVGTPVELVRFAPLGDPVEIKVRGYHLTLRKHEAEQIWVKRK